MTDLEVQTIIMGLVITFDYFEARGDMPDGKRYVEAMLEIWHQRAVDAGCEDPHDLVETIKDEEPTDPQASTDAPGKPKK